VESAEAFVSTSFVEKDGDKAELMGDLTLRGITRQVKIDFEHVGHGEDPWGNYRRGFSGSTVLTLKNFGIEFDLGPQARQVEVLFSVEGIQQK
jgi:polyisoprenoid-binding protein YceI